MQGVELLAHARGAPSLETRRRWRRHGRICAVEDELWELRPVRITRGAEVFTGQNMRFDTRSGQYELQGRVRAVLPPRQTP